MAPKKSQQQLKDKAKVLIALAAQPSEKAEHPPSPEELADFFANSKRFSKQRQDQILAYLDSNPNAYERWIKQGKAVKQQRSAPSRFLITPYAIATYVLLLTIGVALFWREQAFELNQAIDHAYQMADFSDDPENFRRTVASLTNDLQQAERPLSFSQAEHLSNLAQAFVLGLQHDLQASDQEPSGNAHLVNMQQEDYQLGRWYILLWTVSNQSKTMSADFWREQLNILDYLQTHYSKRAQETNMPEVKAVIFQLERIQTVLQQLAENNQAVKSYRQLAQVLTALRYSLIPSI